MLATHRDLVRRGAASAIAGSLLLAASGSGHAAPPPPSFLEGQVLIRHFNAANDLLTAGLGWSGIANGLAPAASDPPTPNELRRLAIWASHRGLISTSASEGFGTNYATLGPVPGPNTWPS